MFLTGTERVYAATLNFILYTKCRLAPCTIWTQHRHLFPKTYQIGHVENVDCFILEFA